MTRFLLFLRLWAIASLFHFAVGFKQPVAPSLAVIVSAIFALIYAKSYKPFAVLAAAQIAEVIYNLPRVSNHWLATSFVNVILLSTIALYWKRPEKVPVRATVPIKCILGIIYFFAVFHKLNTDFLFTEHSCAITLTNNIFAFPKALQGLLPWATVGVEALIPFLLFSRRPTLGILIGGAFHLVLSFDSSMRFMNFSSMLFALYALFLPEEQATRICDRIHGLQRVAPFFSTHAVGKLSLAVCLLYLSGATLFLPWLAPYVYVQPLGLLLFLGLGLLVLITHEASLFRSWINVPRRLPKDGHACLKLDSNERESSLIKKVALCSPFLTVAIYFVIGIFPYVGLPSGISLAMFSNLSTSFGATNHLIIKRDLIDVGIQTPVVVRRGMHPYLRYLQRRQEIVPRSELLRHRIDRNDVAFEYSLVSSPSIALEGSTLSPPWYWPVLRKFLRFQNLQKPGSSICRH